MRDRAVVTNTLMSGVKKHPGHLSHLQPAGFHQQAADVTRMHDEDVWPDCIPLCKAARLCPKAAQLCPKAERLCCDHCVTITADIAARIVTQRAASYAQQQQAQNDSDIPETPGAWTAPAMAVSTSPHWQD